VQTHFGEKNLRKNTPASHAILASTATQNGSQLNGKQDFKFTLFFLWVMG